MFEMRKKLQKIKLLNKSLILVLNEKAQHVPKIYMITCLDV